MKGTTGTLAKAMPNRHHVSVVDADDWRYFASGAGSGERVLVRAQDDRKLETSLRADKRQLRRLKRQLSQVFLAGNRDLLRKDFPL